MSYSFSVRASSKTEALAKVAAELAQVVQSQPVHAVDQAQAQAAAESFVNLLAVSTRDVIVSVNGSVSQAESGVLNVSVGVTAYLAVKEKTA